MENVKLINNTEHNGLELYFETRPQAEILTLLKNNKWKWHSAKRCWYTRATEQNKALAETITSTKITLTLNTAPKTPQASLKYLQNGIKTQSGEYVACWYDFNNLDYSITATAQHYKDIPLPNDRTGIHLHDDTDLMTDYFDYQSLIITPQSIEYLSALATLEKINGKKWHNFSINAMAKGRELATAFITAITETEKQKALETLNNTITQNKEKQSQEEHERQLNQNKLDIESLRQNKYGFYNRIVETENFICGIEKRDFQIYDFSTPNPPHQTEYTIKAINKNTFEAIHKVFDTEEEANNFIETL